jgi:ferredoxin-type protein NapG
VSGDRRRFFQTALRRTGRLMVDQAERKATRRAARWIRPPFALPELDFLLACTRCGACVEACPHQVVFPLPARFGLQAANTPALDLLNHGCRLCADWPCVAACEPGALQGPETRQTDEESPPPPRLATARIDPARCLPYAGPECGACAPACPVPGALSWTGTRPHIEPDHCLGCAQCREACITEPPAIEIRSLHAAEAPGTR